MACRPYKKEIDLAKANGNEADLRAYTRRLKNFQQRLIDEKQAYEAATARTNYFEALSEVATRNLSGASATSLQQTAKTAATNITEQSGELQQAAEKIQQELLQRLKQQKQLGNK